MQVVRRFEDTRELVDYLIPRLDHRPGTVAIFDLDGTLVTPGRGGSTAATDTRRLYTRCQDLGYQTHVLTGRHRRHDSSVVGLFVEHAIPPPTRVHWCNPSALAGDVGGAKADVRRRIAEGGARVALNVGDRWGDLVESLPARHAMAAFHADDESLLFVDDDRVLCVKLPRAPVVVL